MDGVDHVAVLGNGHQQRVDEQKYDSYSHEWRCCCTARG